MATITDEFMQKALSTAKEFYIVILKATQKRTELGVEKILWEHVRRNFSLREDGILPIVCPINDKSDIRGIGIFNTSAEEVRKLMDEDPGVKAEIFRYEIHPCRGFPGDCLPK